MKKFWQWMITSGHTEIRNKDGIVVKLDSCGDIITVCYCCGESYADIPKQMLIGYMEEYIWEKGNHTFVGVSHDNYSKEVSFIDRRFNDLKKYIEEMK